MSNLAELEQKRIELLAIRDQKEKAYKREMVTINTEIDDTMSKIIMILNGVDMGLVELAESVIYVRGYYTKAGEDRDKCRQNAIDDLAFGGELMRKEFFGTKNYAQWTGQGSNHSYGCGPAHGHIIFEIGLNREFRGIKGRDLTPEETSAAIYYLRKLEEIQEAKKKAAEGAVA